MEHLLEAAVGSVAGGLALALALVVFAVGPDRGANRAAAFLLFLEGAAQLAAATAFPDPAMSAGFIAVFYAAAALIPAAYALVLRRLDTPLVAWLRPRAVPPAALVAGVALAAWAVRGARAAGEAASPAATPLLIISLVIGVCSVFGLFASISALRRTPAASARRTQARAFAIAFGARDAIFGLYAAALLLALSGGPRLTAVLGVELPYFATLAFVPLMAYGILQSQLFDIDLKIKWAVRQSTIAATFVAAFFLASEGAQLAFEPRVGPWAGLAATAALVFALAPLQRAAERVAEAAMPRATGSAAYVAFRKLEVYKAAVESANESGGISDKERESLRRLRAKLGIGDEDASAVERDVVYGEGASRT